MSVRKGNGRTFKSKIDLDDILPGDRLLVKSIDWFDDLKELNSDGVEYEIRINKEFFPLTEAMSKMCGKVVTVREVLRSGSGKGITWMAGCPSYLKIEENSMGWLPEMFECIVK